MNWPEIARCLTVLRPVEWVDRKALAYFREEAADKPVVVACSGGCDSVFLVLVMNALLEPGQLHVAYFDHGVRGKASEEDGLFVKGLCDALNLAYHSGSTDNSLSSDEASLRKARYEWLEAVASECKSTSIITGHHADDVIESQLMALSSGTGPAGMSSPLPVRVFPNGPVRVRPLIAMKRSTIERTLESLGAEWREDKSNADTAYTRNRIRHKVIPVLKESMPQDVYAASNRTRVLMEEAAQALDAWLSHLKLSFDDPNGFDASALVGHPSALARRALMAWWMRFYPGISISPGAGDQLVEILTEGRPGSLVTVGKLGANNHGFPEEAIFALHLNDERRLFLQQKGVNSCSKWIAGMHWCPDSGPVYLPNGAVLKAVRMNLADAGYSYKKADPIREAWVTGVKGPLCVRQWQPGDRYRPLGAPGRRKLQDLFTDAKLNSEQKAALPVLLDNHGNILWVPGFPPSDEAKVCQKSISALILTYQQQ